MRNRIPDRYDLRVWSRQQTIGDELSIPGTTTWNWMKKVGRVKVTVEVEVEVEVEVGVSTSCHRDMS
jgi:hypothetical protein